MNGASIDTSTVAEYLEIAQRAAREAGSYLKQKLGHAAVQYAKSLRDALLDADLEAEKILLNRFHQETPHLGTLSEEAGFEGDQSQYWIIDPLDGSANFQHGSPVFAVAIALVVQQQTVAAIIYLPLLDEMFTAIRGQGTYLNAEKVVVSRTSKLTHAIAHFGDFTKEDDPEAAKEGISDFANISAHVMRIRMIGTAATDLAFLACGRADLLLNHTTNPWDIEAGKLLAEEAGGKVTSIQRFGGKPLTLYSNTILHEEALNVL